MPTDKERLDRAQRLIETIDAPTTKDLAGFVQVLVGVIRQAKEDLQSEMRSYFSQFRQPKDGKDGAPGRDGKDGAPGPKGDTGPAGESIVGPAGKDGRDGSPDMAEDIRNKLELLTGDERLDASAIKGLPEIQQEARRVISGGLTRMKTDSLYTKFHGGASNIYVSATEPENPELHDLWVDIS